MPARGPSEMLKTDVDGGAIEDEGGSKTKAVDARAKERSSSTAKSPRLVISV